MLNSVHKRSTPTRGGHSATLLAMGDAVKMAVGSSNPHWTPPFSSCSVRTISYSGRWLGVKLVVARVMNNKPKKGKKKYPTNFSTWKLLCMSTWKYLHCLVVTHEGYILYVWWPFAHHLVAMMMASGVTERGEKEHNVSLVLQNTSQRNWWHLWTSYLPVSHVLCVSSGVSMHGENWQLVTC